MTVPRGGIGDGPGMSPARLPHRRILIPFVLALVLAAESIAVASTVVARSAATDGSTTSAAPFIPLATDAGARERSARDDAPVFDPRVAPIAEPAAVSESVSQLLDSLKMRRARVASALSGHSVIDKRLSLPPL